MRPIAVETNQNILDVCLQVYGTLDALFDLALENNMGITDDIQAGQTMQYTQNSNPIAAYYAGRNHRPATQHNDDHLHILEGIDYWAIEIDFVVQ